MGILDDAIREHLDLKRRQGADQDELARLEDEAFGPPSRPGDPDFAERPAEGEATPPNGDRLGEESEPAAATATDVPAFLDQESEEDAAPIEAAVDESTGLTVDEQGVTPPGEPTVEHDTLGAESEPEDIELEIDDLELDDEIADVGELEADEDDAGDVEEAEAEPEASGADAATEEPIESLDTIEHHFEDALDEAEVVEDEPEGAGKDVDDDDVLEETPEFLRDAPEDDELWFEQGEPKDFDF